MHFNQLLKQTIVLKLVNTVLMFLINLLMVRLLGVAGSGIFFYDIALLSFLILIISGSLESGILYYSSKNGLPATALVTFVLPLLITQAISCWLVLSQMNFSINNNLALLFIFSNLTVIYFSAFLYGKKSFFTLNVIGCSVNLLTALLLFYWWASKHEGQAANNHFILVYIVGIFLQAFLIVMVTWYGREVESGVQKNIFPVIKNIFTYSAIAFVSNVVFFLVTRIDYFFVEKYCSSIALSNYVQVSKFGQLLILVPSIIASVVFPYSADNSSAMSLSKVQQLCRGISLIFIPVAAVVILTSYWVFPWIFGNGFNRMYVALLFYLPGFFALSILTVLAAYLAGKKHLKANLVASILALLIVIVGDVMLIPAWGIEAAAMVSSIAYITCASYLLWFSKKAFGCSLSEFFSLKRGELKIVFTSLRTIFHRNKIE